MTNFLTAFFALLFACSASANMPLKGGEEHIKDPQTCSKATASGGTGEPCGKDAATSAALDSFPYWDRRGAWCSTTISGSCAAVSDFDATGITALYLGSFDEEVGWVVNCDHCAPVLKLSANDVLNWANFRYVLYDSDPSTQCEALDGDPFSDAGCDTLVFKVVDAHYNTGSEAISSTLSAASSSDPGFPINPYFYFTNDDIYIALVPDTDLQPGAKMPSLADGYGMVNFAPTQAFYDPDPWILWLAMGTPGWRGNADRGWYVECANSGVPGWVPPAGCLLSRDMDTSYSPQPAVGSAFVGDWTRSAYNPDGITGNIVCTAGGAGSTNKDICNMPLSWMNTSGNCGRACIGGEGCRKPTTQGSGGVANSSLINSSHVDDSGCNEDVSGYAEDQSPPLLYLGPVYEPSSRGNIWTWVLEDNYGSEYLYTQRLSGPNNNASDGRYRWNKFSPQRPWNHPSNFIVQIAQPASTIGTPSQTLIQGALQLPEVDIGYNHYLYNYVTVSLGDAYGQWFGSTNFQPWPADPNTQSPQGSPALWRPIHELNTLGQGADTLVPVGSAFGYEFDWPLQDSVEQWTHGDSGSHDFVFWKGKWYWVGSGQVALFGGHPMWEARWDTEWRFFHGKLNDAGTAIDPATHVGFPSMVFSSGFQ